MSLSADDQCLKFWPPRVNSGLLNGSQLMAVMDPEFFFSIYKLCYIISSVMHAFWLVLTYDLLEDRRIDDVIIKTFFNSLLYKTNRFQVAMRLFSNRSQRTSKCGKNISDTLSCASCATFLFLPHFDVICDLFLNRCTATRNLFVKYIYIYQLHWVSLSIKDVVEYFIVWELWSWIANLYFEICFRNVQICRNVFLSSEIWPSTCGESFLIWVSL